MSNEQANVAKITVGVAYATIWFSQLTSPELKAALKKLPWVKWQKKEEEEKIRWYLHVDLSDNETDRNEDNFTRLQQVVLLLEKNYVTCLFRSNKEKEYTDDSNKYVWKKVTTRKYFVWLQPSYYEKLQTLASEKGMTFSQLIVCATDEYMRGEKSVRDCGGIEIISPIDMLENSSGYIVNSFSEQIRMEMARQQTKPAWVADKINMPRSRFYSKLDSGNWSEDEKDRIRTILKL